ncbi:phosphoglucosamine mutase [Candidatus Saccharibacteria bacterium]|nr:phosphoglucosamine mutase [Candidatus Saccharibacteria bacterium]
MISVSGIRGVVGESLTPSNLVAYAQGFAAWLKNGAKTNNRPLVLIGRDTRPSGKNISILIIEALNLSGVDVIDIGIATTPTVELAVIENRADGGIIITASHNPIEWNALKLLNAKGEFLSQDELNELLAIVENSDFSPARWDVIGKEKSEDSANQMHIDKILNLTFIDRELISRQNFTVLVDAVEGAGSKVVPDLCNQLGIKNVETIDCGSSGIFPRNPEPIADNLSMTIERTKQLNCDFGIIVDPDVDRLALVCENGELFGEEYTLVACADFYLKNHPGTVVNNLSSSRALKDIASRYNSECFSALVGEANVVATMKEKQAVIGGEGNGGVILPELHYGRDALVGIGLLVQAFADWRESLDDSSIKTLSAFRKTFPEYAMAKKKLEITLDKSGMMVLFDKIAKNHPEAKVDRRDGIKLDFADSWAHLRASNTEPIVRIYTEAKTSEVAEDLADRFIDEIRLG